ncbi:MAG: hypothetical protein ABW221_13145 [Vicinamibacteria bacterium]
MPRCLTLLLAALVPASAGAGWSSDPAVNTQVPTQITSRLANPMLARDVTGNLLVLWVGSQPVGQFEYIHHVQATLVGTGGDPIWGPRSISEISYGPPAGGAAVLAGGTALGVSESFDFNPPIRRARVVTLAPDGTDLWTTNGTSVEADWQVETSAVGVGAGVVMAWAKAMQGPGGGIVSAQRIGPAGQREWGENGVPLCTHTTGCHDPFVVADDADGALVVWTVGTSFEQLYAQRLAPNGTALWAAGGFRVAPTASRQTAPVVVADGTGGVAVAWLDDRSGAPEVYAQRLDRTGTPLWPAGGVRVAAGPAVASPRLVALGGGIVVAWTDRRNGHADVFAQRLSAAGAPLWPADGLPVTAAPGDQTLPILLADGLGGVVLAWQDRRGATWDVYAQRLNPDGSNVWTDSGRPVSIAANDQTQVAGLADGAGGAYFVWTDLRHPFQAAVYAAHVHATGVLPVTLGGFGVE